MDAPLVFDDANLESQYRPDNDNNRYNGPTPLREALYRSINLVSMRVLLKVGAGHVLDHVSRFGFGIREFPRNTQLAIGGGTMAVTPLTMARAYAVLANGGYLVEPHIIREIRDVDGNVIFAPQYSVVCRDCDTLDAETEEPVEEPTSLLELLAQNETDEGEATSGEADAAGQPGSGMTGPEDNPEPEPGALPGTLEDAGAIAANGEALPPPEPVPAMRVLDERNVFVMKSMLRDVIRRGTGGRARALKRGDLAGKTGTTNDAADTWFNGFNEALVATVWVGFSNHAPLGARAYGSNTPLPIWIDFMREALSGVPEAEPVQPPGIVSLKVDPATGKPALPNQPDAVFEFFMEEFAPSATPADTVGTGNAEEPVKAIDLF